MPDAPLTGEIRFRGGGLGRDGVSGMMLHLGRRCAGAQFVRHGFSFLWLNLAAHTSSVCDA